MTNVSAATPRMNLTGSLWMVASMAAFSFEDAFLKLASAAMPVSHVMLSFGSLGMLVFALLCRARRQSMFPSDLKHFSVVLRFGFEVFGRLFFTLSLVLCSLSSTVAILQATPLVVVGGAALVFHERISVRRWLAIFVGLLGVLLILRPAASDFSVLSLLAVLGMLGLALRDLATRAAPRTIPNAVLGFYSFASIVVAGVFYAIWEGVPYRMPDILDLPVLAGAALAGALGYIALTEAMRTGDVSVVTPFRYTRLVCGAVFGVMLFGETIGIVDLAGTALIVGSGMYVLLRANGSRVHDTEER
ncbi:DMT family transporter [Aliiroseovarius sp. S2029]|uniref:DMT family transporter n=1 Tax=Aliiroseovarius sp. S2029 TaxID=2936988 RepID=UPI0020C17A19|nr:DMT family transporter [Aliiroseovarius sp. S2029]MCK8484205.1 DMT family transporter [Aliiroseovarius sp. S2029]